MGLGRSRQRLAAELDALVQRAGVGGDAVVHGEGLQVGPRRLAMRRSRAREDSQARWERAEDVQGEEMADGGGPHLGPGAVQGPHPRHGSRLFLRRYKPDQVQRDHGFHHISARRVPDKANGATGHPGAGPQYRSGRQRVDQHPAVQQAQHARGLGRMLGRVGHHDQGRAFVVELPQDAHDLVAMQAVEVAGGLVGQQQGRLGDDGSRDGHALLLAARELAGPVPGPVADAQPLHRLGHALLLLARRQPAVLQCQGDVLGHAQVVDQVEALEHEPDAAAAQPVQPRFGPTGHVLAVEPVLAPMYSALI
eukprot:Opistho-2@61855